MHKDTKTLKASQWVKEAERKWEKESFCREKEEVEQVGRKWKGEEDEEKWEEKKRVGNRWEKYEEVGRHLEAKLHVV